MNLELTALDNYGWVGSPLVGFSFFINDTGQLEATRNPAQWLAWGTRWWLR